MQTSAVLGCLAGNIRDFYKSTMRATRPLSHIIRVWVCMSFTNSMHMEKCKSLNHVSKDVNLAVNGIHENLRNHVIGGILGLYETLPIQCPWTNARA